MVDAVGATQRLHRIMLAWDYWEVNEKLEESGGVFDKLRAVPSSFSSMKEYKDVFEPLVLEECCAQILRGMEEGEVLTPHKAVVATSEQREDFLYCTVVVESGCSELYSDNDLVLLSKDDPYSDNPNVQLHLMAFCEAHSGAQGLLLKCLVTDESQAGNVKGTQRIKLMRAGLMTKNSTWYLLKLSNMSTITREWIALQHAHLCPFADILTSCNARALHESRHMDIPPGMKETMEVQCNASQMDALQAGLDGTPVVLIQGPPGTGKTRTILNLLSVVMHSAQKGALELQRTSAGARQDLSEDEKQRLWLKQAPWMTGHLNVRELVRAELKSEPTGPDVFGMLLRPPPTRVGRNTGPKAHVLVCAPSNSALDEIVIRILKSGLMDKDGKMYAPSVVRVGVNVHHSIKSMSLDAIVDSRLGDQSGTTLTGPERDRMRIAILDEASIVCSTLSFAGSSIFYRLSRKFDVVVIDEAAQCVEPSMLVPLVMGCKQVYLVGDPVQLPATVISRRALEYNYDTSLFKRLQAGGYPVKILNTQYRMNPAISRFPSKHFYGGKLLDGESVVAETHQAWHDHRCFGPFAFYDIAGKESNPQGSASIQNNAEAHMVLCVFRELMHRFPSLRRNPSVGVISPYKSQVKLLRESFAQALGEEGARMVDINTIDGFQGREKDIILFSCVRSVRKGKRPGSIGFVADERRINVGLTRARCSLIVIGNSRALRVNGNWAGLIHEAMSNDCFFRPKPPYADWMTSAVEGKAGPVKPSADELALLEKVVAKAAAAKEQGDHVAQQEDAEVEGADLEQELEVASEDGEAEDADEGDVGKPVDGAGEKAGKKGGKRGKGEGGDKQPAKKAKR